VATRPVEVNGLGLSAAGAERDVAKLLTRFHLLRDERRVFELWHRLVVYHKVSGKNAHDARLVAAMNRHGVTRMLTFNCDDFKRYDSIEVIDPRSLAGE
jgi:predicted nucleic acid-binding protein